MAAETSDSRETGASEPEPLKSCLYKALIKTNLEKSNSTTVAQQNNTKKTPKNRERKPRCHSALSVKDYPKEFSALTIIHPYHMSCSKR